MPYTAAEIASHVRGEVIGDASLVLNGFALADLAQPGDLTFAENERYFRRAEQSLAAAVLIDGPFASPNKTLIRVASARIAFAKVMQLFFPEPAHPAGIHPTAAVASTAQVDPTAYIGPYCVVDENARIGPGCVLHALNFVGPDCQLGADVHLFPNVVLYSQTQLGDRVRIHSGSVIGADGFGYVLDGGVHIKVPQIGNVIVREDVEIGANVTIDRGALGPTVVGRGSKIDNLVQLGHNAVVGDYCLVVAQAGIAGSTKLGNYVTLGGQVGLAGHLKIGNRVTVAAQSGVMHNIPDGEAWLWTPAKPERQAKRQMIALQQLPELLRRVHELEKKLGVDVPSNGKSKSES
jgi:UDP-3-O-[3-hydroxymyristoyl] glucosamine N-acyltransferase